MQRSRSRKLKKMGASGHATGIGRVPVLLRRAPIAAHHVRRAAIVAADTADTGGLAEVVVTAQKRAENLQDVPLSITAIGSEKLEQLGVQNFDDYVKYCRASLTSRAARDLPACSCAAYRRRQRQPLRSAAERRRVPR